MECALYPKTAVEGLGRDSQRKARQMCLKKKKAQMFRSYVARRDSPGSTVCEEALKD